MVDLNGECTLSQTYTELRVSCAVCGQARELADGCVNRPQTTMKPCPALAICLAQSRWSVRLVTCSMEHVVA